MALLRGGDGPTASLIAAWSTGSGSHWVLSSPVRLGGAKLTSASFGPGGAAAIVLNGNQRKPSPVPRSSWGSLPALPPGTATLPPAPGGFGALAVHRTKLTVWQLRPAPPLGASRRS